MAELLAKCPTPAALRRAGEARLGALLRKHPPRAFKQWAKDFTTALAAQAVVVSGTEGTGIVLPELARSRTHTRASRAAVLARAEELVEDHPLHVLLKTMPGIGIRTQTGILIEVSSKDFATAGHLASYAGLAPVTWRSGTSIRLGPLFP